VPRDFWQVDQVRDALDERHMGHVVLSYRTHPYHGRKRISQEIAAQWLGVSQAQLSRIEAGPPVQDLNRLVQWAKVFRIPPELLWFDLPDDGDDMKRRQFLVAGGATAIAVLPAGASPKSGLNDTLSEQDCIQWLAWELWRQHETVFPGRQLPRPIARVLKTLPSTGGIVLRDPDDNYFFAHQSLADFFVAQRIFDGIAKGRSEFLATAQTSHDTDQVIQRFVINHGPSVTELGTWMRTGATPVLRVNSAGILAKTGTAGIADEVITSLKGDKDARHLYITAVASRVLALPWDAASQFATRGTDRDGIAAGLSGDHVADLATRLSHEILHSHDGAARWCSVVLLSSMRQPVPANVTTALHEALRNEPSRENLRAIGAALGGTDLLA
jgi:transcriptional regulator with XRE-family HTH domain